MATSCKGLQGPPLVADAFLSHWHTQPLSDLAGKIRNTMPAGATGTLTPQQSVDLVAFILKTGGFPAGKTDLAADEAALGKITWPAGLVAAAPRPPRRAASIRRSATWRS